MPEKSSRRRVYFLSDLHLGAGYISDARAHEARVTSFLRHIAADAVAVVLVGDVLDYWFEYRDVVPRGHVRFMGALAALTDAGIPVYWITGNHDIWSFGYLADELGVKVVDSRMTASFLGSRFHIAHGDDLGRVPWTYRLLRGLFHNRICQRMYASLHPRWTVGFARSWSRHSRAGQSEPTEASLRPTLEALTEWARDYSSTHPDIRYIITGHLHVPYRKEVGEACELVVLGDWITRDSFAVFDGENLRLEHYDTTSNQFKEF